MEVKQIFSLVNDTTEEVLGKTDLLTEDLQGVVDLGNEIFNANAVDRYVKSLINHIGKVIFVNRPYSGSAPSVLMDSWEFGSVLEKIQAELPEATENESWLLEDGQSYDPNIFYQPKVSAKFYNSKVTFEIPMSFTELQVKQSFSSAEQLNSFISMLYNEIDKAMTIKVDGLIMRTINNFVAEIFYDLDSTGAYGGKTGIRARNLLYEYNSQFNQTLAAADALTTPEFIRFAAYQIGLASDRLTKISTLFNIGGKPRFTPKDLQHVVMLADFKRAADVYLQSDTYNEQFTRLVDAETVPYWQGSGQGYDFEDISSIDVITSDNHAVSASGILTVIFDRDALGVTNYDRRVTSNYNPKAEFYSNWYKMDSAYFNDLNENGQVFYIADPE